MYGVRLEDGCRLIEVSLVNNPANPHCRIVSMDGLPWDEYVERRNREASEVRTSNSGSVDC